ncbi:thiosulfate oxidation carrier protein SoxY [Oharaeibacter diazotrophicus]|uniref:Thiosulfate-binding protein SoxY n=1 Tax=Oharaeibacter diazotrophicus TaxID=1920512 RepID=A0A4V3CWF6_9HYPH|nr:thiosulfate oxidation carrier protein SoxY [Oharaeibacter diazotrophicus]TDP86188.1 thiosulfate-binding protein SoxY [Oharaeibacter diazotrophicus]BBE71871.1 sulfur oxidation protein SoxY [Pleomorphomonas sp. SM30]GLS78635.1 hypothetical protein GCM10007904_39720 [Oharaeibacter diazotrophicus]
MVAYRHGPTRRLVVAGLLAATVPGGPAAAAAGRLEAEIAAFAAGLAVTSAPFGLTVDAAVESGYTVPVSIVPAGLAAGERLEAVRLFAPENPLVRVATFHFGPSATGRLSTRIRLARSQAVVALARTSAGRVLRQERRVEVLVGGCGFDVEEKAG